MSALFFQAAVVVLLIVVGFLLYDLQKRVSHLNKLLTSLKRSNYLRNEATNH